ncbi:sensor histidine kinase [uncultured Vibrio sp.]|uniref:sensor histidine kinase n=1 Tax=uncultured Vibrio sp. TaxID=114054 RepID=UPI00261C021A|nr:sensor histidine kinase [uncultured Vibrio sp.]
MSPIDNPLTSNHSSTGQRENTGHLENIGQLGNLGYLAGIGKRSIRSQFIAMSVGLVIIMGTVVYILADNYGRQTANNSFDQFLTGAALQISETITIQDHKITANLPWSVFETLSIAEEDRAFYQVIDIHGNYVTGYQDLPLPDNWYSLVEKQSTSLTEPVFYDAPYSGEVVRFIAFGKLLTEPHYSGVVTIIIGQTQRARQSLAGDITLNAIQLVFPFICIGFFLVLVVIWQTLQPIHRLNRSIAKRNPSDLTPINHVVPAEIVPLVSSINRFMGQISSSLERLESFTAEAAHQLRTPLAGIKSQTENAITEPDETLRQMQLKRVLESCDMLSSTIDQLLERATLSHRMQSQQLQLVRLDELAKQVCRDVVLAALHNGVDIGYIGEAEATVVGDDFVLQQMLRNVIENSIKYSKQGDSIDIELHKVEGENRVILLVRDFGVGIKDEEKEHVFERFYHSPTNPRSGTGLGLSIVKEIADYHHAQLELLDNKPQGLIMKFTFPTHVEVR